MALPAKLRAPGWYRAAVGDFPGGLGAEGGVAGPDRNAGGEQRADVPDLLCGSDGFLLWPDGNDGIILGERLGIFIRNCCKICINFRIYLDINYKY